MKLISSFTKNNRHHVGTEDSPDEVRDEMLAHIGLEDQDKLVESTIKRVLRNLEQWGGGHFERYCRHCSVELPGHGAPQAPYMWMFKCSL